MCITERERERARARERERERERENLNDTGRGDIVRHAIGATQMLVLDPVSKLSEMIAAPKEFEKCVVFNG